MSWLVTLGVAIPVGGPCAGVVAEAFKVLPADRVRLFRDFGFVPHTIELQDRPLGKQMRERYCSQVAAGSGLGLA